MAPAPRASAWRAEPTALTIWAKAQPRARRPGLQGLADGADGPRLRLAVNEAPEDGRANRALCAALAKALGVPPSAVAVAAGGGSREKTLTVAGEGAALAARLAALLAPSSPPGGTG